VQASLKAGTTVDAVARLYGVHASQIYDWRKQHRQSMKAEKRSILLPVQVTEAVVAAPENKERCKSVIIEARSVRVTLNGSIDAAVIATVLGRLAHDFTARCSPDLDCSRSEGSTTRLR
jgi:transposase-like protein